MKRWIVPARVVEYRDVVVEAETRAEAMERFRERAWVDGYDPDDDRTEVYKAGKIREEPPGLGGAHRWERVD